MSYLHVRPYAPGDAVALAELFHRAVQDGTSRHYSERQRTAWSPAPPDGTDWEARLSGAETLVAERDRRALGFMTLVPGRGYLDFAYVAPDAMGKGVADALYAVIEGRARAAGVKVLTSDASELARSFLLRQGWRVVARQEIERRGVLLHNYRMEKSLRPADVVAS